MKPNPTLKVFLVDDDPYCLSLYEQYFRNLSYTNLCLFHKSADCLNELTRQPDVIFLDYNMDNLNGLDILKKIKRFDPNIMVFFVSGQETISVAVDALKYGAFDYIVKHEMTEERIQRCLEKVEKIREILLKKKKQGLIKNLFASIGASSIVFFFQKLSSKL